MTCPHTFVSSVSPGGRCVICAKAAGEERRAHLDGWSNALTGIGDALVDKRMSTYYTGAEVITPEYAEGLWRGDDLAARIVETWPNEMLRQGYEICVQDGENTEETESLEDAETRGDALGWARRRRARFDAAKKGGDLAEDASMRLEELGADAALHTALCYRRAYGGGAILIGANDGSKDLSKPLRSELVTSVDFLTVLEPRELIPRYYYADPRAPKFNQVAVWQMQTVASGNPLPGDMKKTFGITMADIHETRLIIFQGARVSNRAQLEVMPGFGDSVFTRVNRVLSDFNTSWASAGILVHDFAQAVFKIKGLAEAMAMDKDDLLKIRMRAVELSRSTARAVLIDSEEEFKREQTPVSGLPELLDKFMTRLASAADMPLTLLMGQSPGGLNATGESDIRFFYDRVASAQRRDLLPALKKLVGLIFQSLGGKPDQWDIEFHPLWQTTDKEQAEARFLQAQIDEKMITCDVYSSNEVARARYGGKKYSFETQIDFDQRERLEVAAPPPVAKDGEDPNDAPDPDMMLAEAKSHALMNPPAIPPGAAGKKPGAKPFPPKGK